jgi:uncharacterized protein (TIGR02996 family)
MEEDAFLRAVLARPADDAPRLVYADWLDDRGESERAEFLRADAALSGQPLADPRTPAVATRVRELALALDPDWVALVRRVNLPDAIEAALRPLERALSGMDHVVSLGLWRVPDLLAPSPRRYVVAALGTWAEVDSVRPVAASGVVPEVGRCLRYAGDPGAGPDLADLASSEVESLIGRVLSYVESAVAEAAGVWAFELKAGHQLYPVHWGFAYLWERSWGAVAFVGASTD